MLAGPNTIGRFRLLRKVGAGGMGVVYEAENTESGERVAVKVLLPHAAEEAEGLLRFKREFRALARLRHPNIVRVLDAGIDQDVPYIAMEYLDGKDARRHLRAIPEGAVRDREAKRILRQLFGALAHIHARRIVHRDLKPENIIVCGDGRVKLMDFGVARLLRAPTTSSGLLGTFAYMAPEQVQGGEIDGRSDLYAVGILLYELLTGEYPFPVEPPAAALHHHVNTPPPAVLEAAPHADATLAALCAQLLVKDPVDRLQTAEEAFAYLSDDEPSASHVDPRLPGQLFHPRFEARAAELDRLLAAVDASAAGQGRLLVLEGPTGIGKSRLVKELRSRVRRRANVLMGSCATERVHAYGPVQAVLDEIETIAAKSDNSLVKKIVGRDAALVRAVSPRLARLGGPMSTEHLDPSERKVRLHKAIVGVVGRLALTRPVVLVIEDLHWADPSTLELLWDAYRTLLAPRPGGAAGETVCPVCMILTRRPPAEGPDASEAFVRRLEQRGEVEQLNLGAMDAAAVAGMVQTMTGASAAPEALVTDLMKAARGRPLLVQEVMESWVADGTLERVKGTWQFRGASLSSAATTDASPSPAPRPDDGPAPGPDEVALSKLGPLGDPARTLLERLALLGRLLSAEWVSALSGEDEAVFLDAMDELVRANLLVEDVTHDGVRYRFYHEGFREAVVRALPAERKTALHLFIAQSLERRFAQRRRELAHVLARHYRAARSPLRAVRYLRWMAEAAAGRGDLAGARRRLEDAAGIVAEQPRTAASAARRLQVLLQEIDLLLDFGRAAEALERADPEVALTARGAEVWAAELRLRRARAQFALGKLDETLATLMQDGAPAPTRSLGARLLELEGRARMARGEYAQARAVLQAGHDVAAEGGHADLAARLEAKLGVVLVYQGFFSEALVKLETGLTRARAREDQRTEADLLGHIGLVHAARGHDGQAVACLREAIELAEARGFKADLARWSGELGGLLRDLDEVSEAEALLEEALNLAIETGSRQGEATWRGERGVHFVATGDHERAGRELHRCLAIAREIGDRRYVGLAEIYLGAVVLEESYDAGEEALEHVRAGLEIAEDLGDAKLEAMGLLQLARICLAEANPGRAREALERARRAARATHDRRLRRRVEDEADALLS